MMTLLVFATCDWQSNFQSIVLTFYFTSALEDDSRKALLLPPFQFVPPGCLNGALQSIIDSVIGIDRFREKSFNVFLSEILYKERLQAKRKVSERITQISLSSFMCYEDKFQTYRSRHR
ncbi:hypothetical protein TNCT_105661 [Trichonephila clavata]|uniref:Uncharacterized protein n=1 Tax=Trichonephila clavata TaxID=2740835 RepID=A0A8X6LHQ2_TRICU|nr:hypothetical protein TNCT_105661 [Trichonephila clavata]